MTITVIEHLTRGTYSFLRGDATEIRAVIPRLEEVLPRPQMIFLRDENEAPLLGFPILKSHKLGTLEKALEIFLEAELEAQCAVYLRQGFDSRAYAEKWEQYRVRLAQAMENVTVARHGGNYAGIFWLHHSLAVPKVNKNQASQITAAAHPSLEGQLISNVLTTNTASINRTFHKYSFKPSKV